MNRRLFVALVPGVLAASAALWGWPPLPGASAASKSCVKKCIRRTMQGRCDEYGDEECGEQMKCVPHCLSHDKSGTCLLYERDFCGPNAVCQTQCLVRVAPKGNCTEWGEEVCTATPVLGRPDLPTACQDKTQCQANEECVDWHCEKKIAVCAIRCKQRGPQAECLDYAPDFCGPSAVCRMTCAQKTPEGVCVAYGPDECSTH